ncbi:MAG: ATP-binding cassette domain-containing protein [Acidimicrobiia bacterium]
MDGIIEAAGLAKYYKEVKALDGLDLSVPEGTILGLLGPNGAGTTTAVSILATLIHPDAGRATVAGKDVVAHADEVRKVIGLSGQYAAVDENLTGFENLDMIGRLYHLGRDPSRKRARELLDRFDLTDAADRPVKTYSGGMRRRLDLAGAIVAEPMVLFLDEPTTGLDPNGRTEMWNVIEDLVGKGTTLLLTTQYLEEADRLADDILVIDHGRAIAHGTSDQLKDRVGGERIEVTVTHQVDLTRTADLLGSFAISDVQVNERTRTIVAPISGGASEFTKAVGRIDDAGIDVSDVGLRRPTLDDVFLTLTGHVAAPETNPEEVKA